MNRPARVGLTVAGIAAGIALCAGIAPYYTTIAVWELRQLLPGLGAFTLVIAVTAGMTAAGDRLSRRGRLRLRFGIVGFLISAVVGLGWYLHTNYAQDRAYLDSLTATNDPLPELGPRAPYQVGVAQARPNLGDTAGDITDTTYLPREDRFATLVNRRGLLSGYEVAFTQEIPLQGRGTADQKCQFDQELATDRVGGWFGHNLGREIAKRKRWVRFDATDVYGYCEGGTPLVVVPLKRQTGFWAVTEKPAGVAIYDGSSGRLHFTTRTTGVRGPSYPISLAARQREATAGLGSFGDWLADRVGWETPDDDVNSGNDREFTLQAAGEPAYVTPLTGRGSATAISVVAVVPAQHSGLRLAPLTVHRLNPVWVSPGAIVDRIKADYQDIPNWQTISVYEVVPTGPNTWVATLGTGQNILYRATGTGDLKGDKPTCLQRADGSTYRCGTLAGVDGNGVGTQYGPQTPGTPVPVPSGDLRSLSDEQLAELQRRVAEEAACRLARTCQRN